MVTKTFLTSIIVATVLSLQVVAAPLEVARYINASESMPGFMNNSDLSTDAKASKLYQPFSKRAPGTRTPRQKRVPPGDCIFKVTRARDIKIDSKQYRLHCESTLRMMVPDSLDNPTKTTWRGEDFKTCRDKKRGSQPPQAYGGRCQCDHLLEPDEFVSWLRSLGFTDRDKAALCNAIGSNSRGEMREIFNGKDNLAGLFGDNKKGGLLNPNMMKNNLLSDKSYKLNGESIKKARSKYRDSGQVWVVASEHIRHYSDQRKNIADKVDKLLAKWSDQIAKSRHPDAHIAQNAFAKLYDPSSPPNPMKTDPMKTLAKAHEKKAAEKMDVITGKKPI